MWDRINKIKGAIALAVIGTLLICLFIMGMIVFAAVHGKMDIADKWLTMLFTTVVSNAFLGFLYVKANQNNTTNNNT